MADIQQIAKSLSEAQRRWLTVECNYDQFRGYYTLPPTNTWRALLWRDLINQGGHLTSTGLAVKEYLERNET